MLELLYRRLLILRRSELLRPLIRGLLFQNNLCYCRCCRNFRCRRISCCSTCFISCNRCCQRTTCSCDRLDLKLPFTDTHTSDKLEGTYMRRKTSAHLEPCGCPQITLECFPANSKELTFTTRLRLTSNSLVATKCKVTGKQRDDSTISKEASSEL